jgi:hypothetical protein
MIPERLRFPRGTIHFLLIVVVAVTAISGQLHELIEGQERAQKQLEAGPVVDIPPTESSTAG